MQEKEITHKGKKIFYRCIGEGPVVVLLHGVPFDSSLWSNQFQTFPGFKLVIPDLPGSGRSEMIEDMSIEGIAECVKDLIVHEIRPPLTPPSGENNAQPLLDQESSIKTNSPSGEFYQEADPLTYKLLKGFVAEHRRLPTQSENILWEQLRGNKVDGYSFRRQHIIGNFIVDFVCLAKKLIIEVDGLIHQLPENKISDEERTLWLGMKGYSVIRFTNDEILFDLQKSLNKIKRKLNELPFGQKKNHETSNKSYLDHGEETPTSRVSAADSSPVGGSRMGAVVIGHSMGGYITLALAEKYPELLNGFGLFHSTAYADPEEKKQARKKIIDSVREKGVVDFVNTSVPNLFSPITKKKNPGLVEEQITYSRNFSAETIVNYQLAMMNRPDRTKVLKNSSVPVLFILGKYDTAVPLKDGLEQCSLANLNYIHILENSGHAGMREEVIETNTILLKYLTNTCRPTQ